MSLKVGVVAHVSRQEHFERLSDEVDADIVCVDDGCSSADATVNHLSALQWMAKHARLGDWAVLLEDDAIVVPGFREEAQACLDHAPTEVVSFYLGTGYPAQHQRAIADAVHKDVRWILHPWMRHAVAYAVQGELLPGLIEKVSEKSRENWAPDDAISAFCLRRGCSVSYSNPSLVDHNDFLAPVATSRTHLGMPTFGRKRSRRAHRFGTPLLWDATSTTV
ncbi:MAG TPA: hypothetical protein VHL57_02395 [Flavobacteriales bacterium]|nr:hypothetical protein [Flavobacteriales bacterium]